MHVVSFRENESMQERKVVNNKYIILMQSLSLDKCGVNTSFNTLVFRLLKDCVATIS